MSALRPWQFSSAQHFSESATEDTFQGRESTTWQSAHLTHWLLALLWQKFSQGYAELNHLRQCGQREGRARVM
jgi:hypothetical protein